MILLVACWFCIIVSVFFLIISCFALKKKEVELKVKIGWGIFTLTLTLIGFLFAVGNDYFSQFNYDHEKIMESLSSPHNNQNYSQIITAVDSIEPHYFFLLDVSKSMKSVPNVELSSCLIKQIEAINQSGKCPPRGFDFDISKGGNDIAYYRALQIRLMYLLLKLYERHGDNLNYSVVAFADSPSDIFDSTNNIQIIFDKIYHMNYEGDNTDFYSLFSHLQDVIDRNISPDNIFKPKECHLVFFSDYLHDTKFRRRNVEKTLKHFIQEMHERSVNMKYYYLLDTANIKTNGLKISILFDEIFPRSMYEALKEDDELICPIVSKIPIAFFYSHSLYEEELTSCITFDGIGEKKELYLGIEPNVYDDMDFIGKKKQEYYLKEGTTTIHLSSNLRKIIVDSNDCLTFQIKGYVPDSYKSPDIIIQDTAEGIRYIMPVTFFKIFPITGYYLFIIIVSLDLALLVLSTLICVNKNKKNISNQIKRRKTVFAH